MIATSLSRRPPRAATMAVAATVATGSDQPSTVTFDPVSTTAVRLVMASAAPGTPDGSVQLSEVEALGYRPAGS